MAGGVVDFSRWNEVRARMPDPDAAAYLSLIERRDQLLAELVRHIPDIDAKLDEACGGCCGRARHSREVRWLEHILETTGLCAPPEACDA